MEAVESLLKEMPAECGHEVVACLAEFAPPERLVITDALRRHVPTVDERLQLVRMIESLFDESEKRWRGAAKLVRALDEEPRHAVGILELSQALPQWRDAFEDLDTESRSRLLATFGEMTATERAKVGATCKLPLRVLLELIDNPPAEACSLCRVKHSHREHFRRCMDTAEVAPKQADQLVPFHAGDLFSFEPTALPGTLGRLGLADSSHGVLYAKTQLVDTPTLCRSCKDEVYAFMGSVGNDCELFHLTGTKKLEKLQHRCLHDATRRDWWVFEAKRKELAATLAALADARRGVQRRRKQAKRDQDAALAVQSERERLERASADRRRMLNAASLSDSKWRANVEAETEHLLAKRTVYAALQFSAKDERFPNQQLWSRDEVEHHGLSSRTRELDDFGVPLTATAASAVFGTQPLVVKDETEALRRDKSLAITREAALRTQAEMLSKHSRDLARAHLRQELERWLEYSASIDEARRRREAREEHEREQRCEDRRELRSSLARMRVELRDDGRRRAKDECRAVENMVAAQQRESEAEAAERLAMMFAETDQCAIDRFWGIPTESSRQRRLDEIRRLIWVSRIALCNDVMRKTESVEPFYDDELQRRKPPVLSCGSH